MKNQQETITHINDHDDANNDDDTTSNNNNNTLNITIEYFKNQEFKKKSALYVIQRLLEVDRGIKKLPLSADWKKNSIQQRKAMINCHVFKIGNHKGGQNQTGEAQEEGSRFN
ncbi:unnamed protein product [Ambrosiozyma monospora]|uniref:Unnamed protein product n=1 Tax=Ambrosiozyma monospora TaxID=43982 RepID=A0A9W6Z060_AMBMO|nr:unnamed protein product [Ambrosiozyma monospora]